MIGKIVFLKTLVEIIFLVFSSSLSTPDRTLHYFSSHHTNYLLRLAVAADGQLHQVIHKGL
jgi:hypothetical protein